MDKLVGNAIEKIIIPKYGPLDYEVLDMSDGFVKVSFKDIPDELNLNNLLDDVKFILRMIGLKPVGRSRNDNVISIYTLD